MKRTKKTPRNAVELTTHRAVEKKRIVIIIQLFKKILILLSLLTPHGNEA